jgi:hypothetical protein
MKLYFLDFDGKIGKKKTLWLFLWAIPAGANYE